MRRLTGAALGWLRRNLKRAPAAVAPTDSAPRDTLAVGEALGLVESLVCDGVVHRPLGPANARIAARMELGREPVFNAWGHPVAEQEGAGPRGSLAMATGMALTGLRTTAWIGGAELADVREGLRDVADRLVPLVLHVGDAGEAATHAGCHSVADNALFQILPHDGQLALDMSLVARLLAEEALVPGLVVSDLGALESLALPDEAGIRELLGRAGEPLQSPTEAQRVLFGGERRRAFRWFDADHPVATAAVRGVDEAARARLGREVFFWGHVADLASQAMAAVAAKTGRPLDFVVRHRLDDAELVLVATGTDAQVAMAIADHLRAASGLKVGVLAVTWLRPFPAEAVAAALGGHRHVAVLERVDGPVDTEAPLFAALRSAVGGVADGWVSAVGSQVAPARLAGLCELLRKGDLPRLVRLDATGAAETGFPRRDALVQSVREAYPRLSGDALPADELGLSAPAGGLSVGLVAHEAEIPPDALGRLARAVSLTVDGPWVRGSLRHPEPGAWFGRVTAAPARFASAGPAAPVDLLMVLLDDPGDLGNPLTAVKPGGAVFIATREPNAAVWQTLPPGWRTVVRERDLQVLLVRGGLGECIATLDTWRDGDPDALMTLDWKTLARDPRLEAPVAPILRHIPSARTAHDSLPRFWGEVAEPRREGVLDPTPDPLAAGGAVPACASALEPDPVGVHNLPSLDAALCTGCGRCWSSCPDSALGASVLGVQPLLDAAAALGGADGKAADALGRAHKNLAGRLAKQLGKDEAETLDREALDGAYTWLADKMGISEDERADYDAAFAKTADVIERLAPVPTDLFFHGPEKQTKGAGELFVLAMDPRACQGCSICVAVCPEDALTPGSRSAETVAAARERWATWEATPDTSGQTVARAKQDPGIGPLAGALLSRHVALAQAGGGVSEPGSGERLAVRLVTGVVEEHSQRRQADLVQRFAKEREALDTKARTALAGSLSGVDLKSLGDALGQVSAGKGELADLTDQLRAQGSKATFDRDALLRMAGVAGQLARHHERLTKGADGLGRARFGVVFARGAISEWAGRFPRQPYFAPVTVEPTAQGVELARGVAQGLMADHVAMIRSLKRAEVVADAPPDVREQLEDIEHLGWQDLSEEERAACPPLLFVGDRGAIGDLGMGWLTRLLTSGLPVKVVMLDGRDTLEGGAEPSLVAMAHRSAYVLATSVAYPDHLAQGLRAALAFQGPALVHIHAPSPRRQGFAADRTIEVARRAVHGRAHILLRYDPRADGTFGTRASLDANPAPDADFGDVSFFEWAADSERFGSHLGAVVGDGGGVPAAELARTPRDELGVVERGGEVFGVSARLIAAATSRLAVWDTLREITGDSGAFAGKLREAVAAELAAEHSEALAALEAAHAAAIAQLSAQAESDMAVKLTDRMMALAGYGLGGKP